MKHFERKIFFLDLLAINLAWIVYYYFRVESAVIEYAIKPDLLLPMVVMYCFWLAIFFFWGMYRPWHVHSRVDEFMAVLKSVTVGCLIIFFVFFFNDDYAGQFSTSRMLIFVYWGYVVGFVGGGRVIYRSIRRKFLASGIGLRNALIVGWNAKAKELYDLVEQYPDQGGYRVVGFVKLDKKISKANYHNASVLGTLQELPNIIQQHNVRDILIALESSDHERLLEIIDLCDGRDVSLKIIPDMYDIISGQARTNQIYGFPLIEIMPHIMQPWEESAKRLVDIVVSLIVLTITFPLWFFIGIAIKIDSKGPVVYSQERVGKDGKIFKMHKFRSMRFDAEAATGPVWAPKKDTRVTKIGRILRNTRLDEIPQFINVLDGDMSLVGPRPERPFFVEKLAKEIPLYKRRLKVRPGITGCAQIKQGYDQTIDDVRSKVRYDLFYIENMSFRMDIKILLITFYVMITGKGN